MKRLQQKKLTRQEPDPNLNTCLLRYARNGLLLVYRVIEAHLMERDIGEG